VLRLERLFSQCHRRQLAKEASVVAGKLAQMPETLFCYQANPHLTVKSGPLLAYLVLLKITTGA
jgi:hypothetical protein